MAYRRTRLMEKRLAGNRERILRAVRQLLAEGGFRKAQITAVAALAGVSTGMIYRYFTSKSELFVEVLNAAVTCEIEVLDAAIAAQANARAQLEAAISAFVQRALSGPELAWAFIAEPVDPSVDAERLRCRKRFGEVFEAILARGVAAGEFPPQSLEVASACIVGAFTQALIGPIGPSRGSVQDKKRLAEAVCAFCLRAVGAAANDAPLHAPLHPSVSASVSASGQAGGRGTT